MQLAVHAARLVQVQLPGHAFEAFAGALVQVVEQGRETHGVVAECHQPGQLAAAG